MRVQNMKGAMLDRLVARRVGIKGGFIYRNRFYLGWWDCLRGMCFRPSRCLIQAEPFINSDRWRIIYCKNEGDYWTIKLYDRDIEFTLPKGRKVKGKIVAEATGSTFLIALMRASIMTKYGKYIKKSML